jgi:peptidoglycan-associated lipoprotein
MARTVPPPAAVIDEAPPPPPPPIADSEPVPVPPAPLDEDEIFARKTIEELNAERPLGDALFDYDQFAIGDDARPVLQRNADWLRRWPSTRIAIEGHADARGTSEYNLALGERRAHAAREYLVSLGIDRDRLVVASKGEESPVCFDENETCWQQNRRVHSIITAK